MKIRVNGEPVDFELETEYTLGEVAGAFERWLADSGMHLRSVLLEGAELDIVDRTAWDTKPVDSVGSLEFVAQKPIEFRAEKLESLHGYFDALASQGEANPQIVDSLVAEAESIRDFLADTVSTQIAEGFSQAIDAIDTDRDACIEFAGEVLPIIEGRWNEIVHPEAVLEALVPRVTTAIQDLGEVAALLQSGHDADAMSRVLRFFELAQTMLRVLYVMRERELLDPDAITVGSSTLIEHQSALAELLSELSSAIADADTITIGDLLEYEIGPRFSDLVSAIEERNAVA